MLKKRGLFVLLGFILAAIGLLSIVLTLIGVQFTFLRFIEGFGQLIAFLIKLCFVVVGFVMMYIAGTDAEGKEMY